MAHSLPSSRISISKRPPVCAAVGSQLPLPDSFEACYLEYNHILPLETTETHVRVAVSGEPDLDVLDDLQREFGRPLTGHKTRAVFDRYDIVNERDLRDGVKRLAALHAARPERRRGTVGGQ